MASHYLLREALAFVLLIGVFAIVCNAEAAVQRRTRGRRNQQPYFRNPNSVHQAKVHETVRFECDVANLGSNVITWKNLTSGRVIFAGPINVIGDDRLKVDHGGRVLVLSAVAAHDSGRFECTVETRFEPISLQHNLNVLVPPRVFPSPIDGNYVIKSGSDVQLVCHAEGSPEPEIKWRRKDGRSLPSGQMSYTGSVLKLPRVDRAQAGVYECQAENGVGRPASAQLNLQVIYQPIVQIKSNKVYAGPGQAEAILECFVYGEPFPKVVWQHQTNHQRPDDSNPKARLFTYMDGNRSVLRISNIDEKDFGAYQCEATNRVGTEVGKVELTGEPERPVILSPADSPSLVSYALRWQVRSPYRIMQQKVNYWEKRPPNSGNNRGGFSARDTHRNELHLQNHEQHRLTKAERVELATGYHPSLEDKDKDTFVYQVNIPDLRPHRTYVVQVKTTNQFHEGEWSEPFEFETSGRVHPPVNVKSGLTSGSTRQLSSNLGFLIIASIAMLILGSPTLDMV